MIKIEFRYLLMVYFLSSYGMYQIVRDLSKTQNAHKRLSTQRRYAKVDVFLDNEEPFDKDDARPDPQLYYWSGHDDQERYGGSGGRQEEENVRGNNQSQEILHENGEQNTRTFTSVLSEFLRTQGEIKKEIDVYCKRSRDLPILEEGFSSLIIDSVNKITYCSAYKVASTSWAKVLLELRESYNEKKPVRDLLDKVFDRTSPIVGLQNTEGTVKFLTVRHPFERIISAYRNKFEGATKYYYYNVLGEKIVKMGRSTEYLTKNQVTLYLEEVMKHLKLKHRVKKRKKIRFKLSPSNPYANPIGPTFEEFIRYVVSPEPDDDHWRPYYIQCSMCYMQYDFILRFENMSQDSQLFLKYLNISEKVSTKWENPTASGPTTEIIGCRYFGQISTALAMELVKKYLHDLHMFNYSYEHYLNCSVSTLKS